MQSFLLASLVSDLILNFTKNFLVLRVNQVILSIKRNTNKRKDIPLEASLKFWLSDSR